MKKDQKENKLKTIRIIVRLDIKGPNVVKGVHCEGLRVVGRPEIMAPRYYEQGVDELIYIDSVASLYGRNNIETIISRTAEKIYVPLTVGGGIRTIEDIRRLLRAGADKVAINTAAIKNPSLISESVSVFGSQCIVVSIQATYRGSGVYECLIDNAREKTGVNVFDWAKKVTELGAGEILLTSVDRDGTGKGYDIELVLKLAEMVSIPVIACGGAGTIEHVRDVIIYGKADAACAASIFHYALRDDMAAVDYNEEGNIDFLKKMRPVSGDLKKNINPTSIPELKKYLLSVGINCRVNRRLNN